jgi:hypothetical protein
MTICCPAVMSYKVQNPCGLQNPRRSVELTPITASARQTIHDGAQLAFLSNAYEVASPDHRSVNAKLWEYKPGQQLWSIE